MGDKPKTLKDICKPQLGQPKSNAILKEFEEELKQETIKRAKHYRELIEKGGLTTSEVGHYSGRIAELKEFNNLTEEDLK